MMMVDFILFVFMLGVFAGGFWCGKKFGSLVAMKDAFIKWIS